MDGRTDGQTDREIDKQTDNIDINANVSFFLFSVSVNYQLSVSSKMFHPDSARERKREGECV